MPGKETGHRGFPWQWKNPKDGFQAATEQPGRPSGHGLLYRWQPGAGKQAVDPLPAVHRFSLRDPVGFSGNRVCYRQPVCGLELGKGGVFHVNHVNHVLPITDPAKPSPGRPFDQPRQQLVIMGAPDKVGTQGTGCQVIPIWPARTGP